MFIYKPEAGSQEGDVIEGFISRNKVVFSGCSRPSGADNITETVILRNIACARAYLHLLYLLLFPFQHIDAARNNSSPIRSEC